MCVRRGEGEKGRRRIEREIEEEGADAAPMPRPPLQKSSTFFFSLDAHAAPAHLLAPSSHDRCLLLHTLDCGKKGRRKSSTEWCSWTVTRLSHAAASRVLKLGVQNTARPSGTPRETATTSSVLHRGCANDGAGRWRMKMG